MVGDTDDEPYRTTHDWTGDESLTALVVEAVADAADVGLTDFELSDYVDPDALNALFRPKHDGRPRRRGSVTVTVEGVRVEISADGKIVVHPPDDDRESRS